ncbi:hypothetical protein Vi05172_g12867 [Venturia inaequalis]|nr:hypothetical protein Vi05172_g12867 [Venturia inaequalis]
MHERNHGRVIDRDVAAKQGPSFNSASRLSSTWHMSQDDELAVSECVPEPAIGQGVLETLDMAEKGGD